MDEKHGIKLNQLDLAKKRLELEEIFDSVIGRIPDLCMPPSVRLAGEDDYFNRTRSIRLEPFRKQRIFETSISPDLVSFKSEAKLPTDHIESSSRATNSPESTCIKYHDIATNKPAKVVVFAPSTKGKMESRGGKASTTIMNKSQIESKKKFEDLTKLHKKYSKLKIKKSSPDELKEVDKQVAYNKLFRNKASRDTNYPFANPMPECMLTDANIDNLREIIVSSVNIEWKMLTPVRPGSEYEEKYFDKLIQLHRNHYRSQLESGVLETDQKVPFRHTRHRYLVQCVKLHKKYHNRRAPFAYGAKYKRRFSTIRFHHDSDGDKKSIGKPNHNLKLTIPTLTLTSDVDKLSQPIEDLSDDHNSDDSSIEDSQEFGGAFNYEDFSRFSRRNRESLAANNKSAGDGKQLTNSGRGANLPEFTIDADGGLQRQTGDEEEEEMHLLRIDEKLEYQVEGIVNNLINFNINKSN